MAWKTPGVYFTEVDNTEYQNPAAEINTTVAIIGFAKKGPIGVPTEITTYNDYKSKFGTPIDGQFAGLAIRNVLSAGGTVLFTRVADETIATKSNVILKNGSEAVDGLLVVNCTKDITADDAGYELSSVYSGRIQTASNEEKNIILRTPFSGRLRLSNMLSQFAESLKDTYGYDEFKTSKVIKNTSFRSFNISVGDDNTSEEDRKMGPFFVKVNGSDSGSGAISNVVDTLQRKLEGEKIYSNAYQKLYVLGEAEEGKEKVKRDPANFSLNIGSEDKKMFQFAISKNGGSPIKKRIEVTGMSDGSSSNYYITMSDLAKALTENLSKEDIYVKWCFNSEEAGILDADYENGNENPYLLFVSMDTSIDSFNILPYTANDEDGEKIVSNSLFVPVLPDVSLTGAYYYDAQNKIPIDTINLSEEFNTIGYLKLSSANDSSSLETVTGFENVIYYAGEESDFSDSIEGKPTKSFTGLFCAKQKCVPTKEYSAEEGKNLLIVEYEKDTVSIKFVAGTNFNVDSSFVKVSKTEFGGFLFNDEDIVSSFSENSTNTKVRALNIENYDNIGSALATVKGEKAINCKVKTVNGQIAFYEEGNFVPGLFLDGTVSKIDGYKDLELLIGKTISESTYKTNGYSVADKCLVEKEGNTEVSSMKQDLVIFKAREYGEGTSNIGVEVYTSVSPINGARTHFISTIVNGITKETWEDVSYDPSAENYFKKLINEEPENNGSAFIRVEVIKRDSSNPEVNLQDTINYNETGVVYLGSPINENSISRTDVNAKESNYDEYDYSLGNNGVPEDTTDLFVDAMDTLDSGLCNKDLYMWHILITPDNITEEVQDAAINLCEYMEDAIYIADPPQGISRDKVIKWHNGKYGRSSALQSNYACTYWPWCKVFDSTSNKYTWAMPSVLMAAQFCKTDNWYAPWYAPAGETCGLIASAIDIEQYPNKNDRDQLYLDQNRINPFLKLKNGNILAFGEKTCQRKNSTLTKIHTRRMLISLKHELRNSIKGFLFMPTMTENIAKIRGIVTAIMEEVKIGGGVSSYVVVCDETNNTTETLQQDILNIAVSCVPTGCIEQVEITFTLNKSAESIS